MLKVGDKPKLSITLQDSDGVGHDLGKLSGWTVLYFYPKDGTPGCTKEACEFRDFNKDIKKLGVGVLGISTDSVESHKKFSDKHELNFTILSDVDRKLHDIFGTWIEKSMYGKKYMGTARSTFILNDKGEVVYVWEKAKSSGHAEEVFNTLKELLA